MRLIEKKCPNCGADLEFDENAKSCKCSYCKRSFEIERDVNDLEKINLVFDKVQKPVKAIFLIPFIFVAVIIILITLSIIFGATRQSKTFEHDDIEIPDIDDILVEKETLIKDASEISDETMDEIERKASSVLHQSVTGRHDSDYAYSTTGDPRLQKTYVASKEDSNRVVVVYSVIYQNFFHQEDQKTVYVPAVINNVKTEGFITTKAKNPAPEFYLNDEHSTYVYAYGSVEEVYSGVIQPLVDEGYTVTEK